MTNPSSSRQEAVNRGGGGGAKQSIRGKDGERDSGGRVDGACACAHRKYVEERDKEERWVRPAGCRGGPERRQHKRCVVHHRHLRDIHRRDEAVTAGNLFRSCPVKES